MTQESSIWLNEHIKINKLARQLTSEEMRQYSYNESHQNEFLLDQLKTEGIMLHNHPMVAPIIFTSVHCRAGMGRAPVLITKSALL